MINSECKPETYYTERREMLRFIPSGVRNVLDIGCGKGNFGALMKTQRSAEVWGVELCPDAAREAITKIDKVITGNIETDSISLPEQYFDCIVCNDVLEHLVSPWQVLRKLQSNLVPNGYIVASIPNVRFYNVLKDLLVRKRWEYRDAGVMDITHLRFFTVNSIRDMFTAAGYQVELLKGINYEKMPLTFHLLNLILLNGIIDMRYVQFACIARKNGLN